MKKQFLSVLLTGSMLVLAGCNQTTSASTTNPTTSDMVIATVGSESITIEEFYAELKSQAGVATLRSMIIEKILTQKVENVDELKKAADDEVNAQIVSAGGEEVFAQLLAYQNLGTVEDFRNSVFIRNLFQEVIQNNIDTSEEAIKAFYEKDYAPLMEAQHILVDTQEEAEDVLERLEAGEEFDALAQELSKDSSAANGGLLSPFSSGQMVAEFEEAVKSVDNGEIVDHPVESRFGFHIIRTINNGAKKPYDEIKDDVKEKYLESKYNDSSVAYKIIGEFVKEHGVDIKDTDLQAALDDLMASIEQSENAQNQETTLATDEASLENNEETSTDNEVTSEETTEAE